MKKFKREKRALQIVAKNIKCRKNSSSAETFVATTTENSVMTEVF
jgi:hypothetical protein